ncbi:hypothetical protein CEXT_718461 [Caerostris extrusa]|uniref:Uncharacterized protein n=1 Tax=Caerostris extrusa TaxID=172846 RepID=A0AAV4MPX4_CAEEX|nr:hypothetical protein CEXT_718461 [Caerostris extrusa]
MSAEGSCPCNLEQPFSCASNRHETPGRRGLFACWRRRLYASLSPTFENVTSSRRCLKKGNFKKSGILIYGQPGLFRVVIHNTVFYHWAFP